MSQQNENIEEALRRIEECRNEGGTSLDLSKLGLVEIPKALGALTSLTQLSLFNNQLIEIKGLSNLTSLTTLRLGNNDLTKIEGLSRLTALTSLGLDRNQIVKIEGLSDLSNLESLGLDKNQIVKIEGLSSLVNLTNLRLNDNKLKNIDLEGLAKLKSLRSLRLGGNRLTKIEGLSSLTSLETLWLDNNRLTKIEGLSELLSLKTLWLNRNSLTKIEGLVNLQSLQFLRLGRNQITKIEGLTSLHSLISLKLGSNHLSRIEGLSDLSLLTTLWLDNNRLTKIEGLSKLVELKNLWLGNNQITKIEGLMSLKLLRSLMLEGNELRNPESLKAVLKLASLEELTINHNPFIESYRLSFNESDNQLKIVKNLLLRNIEKEKLTVVLPARMLLLGNHGAGKSSLLHYLHKGNIDFKGKTTHVLKIEPYGQLINENILLPQAIFFDFGGQDYYHGIYRMFLTDRAGHILVFNSENNINQSRSDKSGIHTLDLRIGYWIGQKKMKNEGCPLILVQNYAEKGKLPDYKIVGQFEGFDYYAYVALKDTAQTPRNNQQALQLLKLEIEAIIKRQQITREEPRWYIEFLKIIFDAQKKEGERAHYATSLDTLLKTYTPTNIPNSKHKQSLQLELEQLHQQGLVLYYKDIEADKVWLNPQAFVQQVHSKILNKALLTKNKGKFSQVELDALKAPLKIKILERQKVIFKHLNGKEGVEYIVPNYLPLVEKDVAVHGLLSFGMEDVAFVIKFKDFIPLGIINQMICHFGELPEQKVFWRDQVIFIMNEHCKVRIRLDILTQRIIVNTHSNQSTELEEAYIYYSILCFYWDWEILSFENYCRWYEQNTYKSTFIMVMRGKKVIKEPVTSFGDDFFGLSSNQENKLITDLDSLYYDEVCFIQDMYVSLNNIDFVSVPELIETDEEKQLIRSVRLDENFYITQDSKDIPLNGFQIFTRKKYKQMKKCMISYSKDDLKLVHRFRDSLVPLHEEGVIDNPWYCTFLEAGANWDDTIQQKIKDCDVVFFMCSMSFVRTKYIRDHEIKVAKDLGKIVIPIILNFCEWEQYFGEVNALPYTAKPVVDFKNQDLAWLLVAKGVRWRLENRDKSDEEFGSQMKKLFERLIKGQLDDNSNS